jgi:hypothetical protein
MNVCVIVTVAMVMMLRDFGPYVFFKYVGWWSFAVKGFWVVLIFMIMCKHNGKH